MNRLCLGILVALIPASSMAWERTMTCDGFSVPCNGNEPLPAYWKHPCVAMHLNEKGTAQMPFETVKDIVITSIDEWHRPNISSLTPHFAGLTDETRMGFNPYIRDNANVIVFRDTGWDESHYIMALTIATSHLKTGQIYDADIEVNTQDYRFGNVDADGTGVVDLQNTLTHELGHVFGFDHSDVTGSTMAEYSGTGETSMRSLDDDDLSAIATVYPPANLTCEFDDAYFEAPPYAMEEAPATDDSCAAAPARPVNHHGFLALLLGLAVLIVPNRKNIF